MKVSFMPVFAHLVRRRSCAGGPGTRLIGPLVSAAATGGAGVLLLAGAVPAAAAGSGYGSGNNAVPGATGNYANVASVQTVPASGGTFVATVNGATITVTVPSGDLTAPAQLVFISGTDPTSGVSGTPELAFGIQLDQGGQKLTGPFPLPIKVSVTRDPAIQANSKVYELSGSSYVTAPGWTVGASDASGSFTVDVDYLIASTPSTTTVTVPSATTPVTGEPFLGESLVGIALIGGGLFGLRRWRKAARPAH